MQALLIESPLTFIAAAFILALLVGSFLNVVIHRLPLMMEREWRMQCAELAAEPAKELPEGRFDVMAPRSRCPQCGHQITALENIPIVSYLMLSGKCSGVQRKNICSLSRGRTAHRDSYWSGCLAFRIWLGSCCWDRPDLDAGRHQRHRY